MNVLTLHNCDPNPHPEPLGQFPLFIVIQVQNYDVSKNDVSALAKKAFLVKVKVRDQLQLPIFFTNVYCERFTAKIFPFLYWVSLKTAIRGIYFRIEA